MCGYPETLRQKPSYPRICHLFLLFIHIIHPMPVRDHPIQGPVKPKHMGKKKQSEFESTVASSKAGLVSILTTSALLLSMQCTGGESHTHMNTSRRHDPSRSLDRSTPSKVLSSICSLFTAATCARLQRCAWVILFIIFIIYLHTYL